MIVAGARLLLRVRVSRPSPIAMPPDHVLDEVWALAHAAGDAGEVPVGAVICRLPGEHENHALAASGSASPDDGWTILGRGRNRILEKKDPSAHAELEALREACAISDSERLARCALVVNLEPCLMCSGALLLARVDTVFYFTSVDSGFGLEDVLELPQTRAKPLNHSLRAVPVTSQSERAAALLRDFFRAKRKNSN